MLPTEDSFVQNMGVLAFFLDDEFGYMLQPTITLLNAIMLVSSQTRNSRRLVDYDGDAPGRSYYRCGCYKNSEKK